MIVTTCIVRVSVVSWEQLGVCTRNFITIVAIVARSHTHQQETTQLLWLYNYLSMNTLRGSIYAIGCTELPLNVYPSWYRSFAKSM